MLSDTGERVFFLFKEAVNLRVICKLISPLVVLFSLPPKKCLLAEFQLNIKYILLFSNQNTILSTVYLTARYFYSASIKYLLSFLLYCSGFQTLACTTVKLRIYQNRLLDPPTEFLI